MATTRELRQRIEAFARQLSQEFGEVDDSDALSWLDAVESRAVDIGDAVAAELLKQKSAERSVDNESTCPKCGKLARYQGDRQRELIGRRGPVSVSEPEYYCLCCRKAFFPSDSSDRR